MKYLYTLVICTLSTVLIACDEKPVDKSSEKIAIIPSTATLSTNNISDINHDLTLIKNITESPEMINLQSDMNQRIDSEGKDGIPSIFGYMKKIMKDNNDKIDSAQLKSSEVSKIKEKLKESFKINIKIADKVSSMELDENGQPVNLDDMEEINNLKINLNEISEELRTDFELLQTNIQKLELQKNTNVSQL